MGKAINIKSSIIVHLKDGTILDFDKKCTYVDYKTVHMATFLNCQNVSHHVLLALIPYENISYIENYPYSEVKNE